MRKLKILFTTEDEIFFVDESKRLEFYREAGDGQNHFREMFGYEETNLDNWTEEQLSEMVSNGLYVDDVDLFELWDNDQQGLFEKHPELFDFVEIDKWFKEVESEGNSKSVLAFVFVLAHIRSWEYKKDDKYIFQCHALAHKLAKKEAKEKADKEATWRAEYEERINNQTRMLEKLLSIEPAKELDFTFEPRIELQNKKAS